MKKRILKLIIFSLFIIQITIANNINIIAHGNNAFAIDLYKELAKDPGNFFFSPYSISSALAMTYAGARGDTAKQMEKVLYFTLSQDKLHPSFTKLNSLFNAKEKSYQLSIANSLWGQKDYPFKKDFLSLVNKYYEAGFNEVNFVDDKEREEARQKINTWVEEKTNYKIKDLIQKTDLNSLTRLVLVNAIYFKGKWQNTFDPKETNEMPFYVNNTQKINTPIMHQEGNFNYTEDEDLQVLEIPYSGNELSMVILLPKTGISLSEVERNLSIDKLNYLLSNLSPTKVDVYIPKFKLEKRFILNEELIKLGMTDAFDEMLADFSGMTGDKDLYISKVIHQSFIEVNEEGTEAAAATAVIMSGKSISLGPILFKADRPFIFLIQDKKTGTILFMGRFIEPTK
mgnify:FL=1